MLATAESIREHRRRRERLRRVLGDRYKEGCPFQLAQGRDSPARVSARRAYYRHVQIRDLAAVKEALKKTVC